MNSLAQQKQKVDSLLNILQLSPPDTIRVNTLNALAQQFVAGYKIDEAKKYTNEALALAERIKFNKGIKDAYINTGRIFNSQANGNMGNGKYTEAIKNYLSALKAYEKIAYKPGMAGVNSNIGRFYWVQKNYNEAKKYYIVALKYFQELGDKYNIGEMHNKIGLLYYNQSYFDEALKYYHVAISMFQEAGEKYKWAAINIYFNIGFMYEDQQKYEEALENHAIALKISEEIDSKDAIAASNINMGDIYVKQGRFNLALQSYLLALKLYQEEGSDEGIASASQNVGTVYIKLGDFDKANKYLNEGLAFAKKRESLYLIQLGYEFLAKSDSAAGNWQGALEKYRLFIQYRDSLQGEEVNKKILKTQMQYEYDKKEDSMKYQQALIDVQLKEQIFLSRQQRQDLLLKDQEVLLLNNEKELQQLKMQNDSVVTERHKAEVDKKQSELVILNKERALQALELNKQKQVKKYLLIGLGLFLVLVFFAYRNYSTRQKLKLQTLRNKIASDLHDDVGSTLSSISIFSQMAQEQSKETIPLLETIGENSRKMLDAMADIVWTIKPENDQFEKIIMRMRNFAYELLGAKKIDFEFIADDEVAKMKLPMEVRKNLYLIFKEATNNMVKYSAAQKAMFAIHGEKNNLTMTIRDDGKGFDISKSTEGNGLKNMKKRAEEIGADFSIDSNPGSGTTIQLKVAV